MIGNTNNSSLSCHKCCAGKADNTNNTNNTYIYLRRSIIYNSVYVLFSTALQPLFSVVSVVSVIPMIYLHLLATHNLIAVVSSVLRLATLTTLTTLLLRRCVVCVVSVVSVVSVHKLEMFRCCDRCQRVAITVPSCKPDRIGFAFHPLPSFFTPMHPTGFRVPYEGFLCIYVCVHEKKN